MTEREDVKMILTSIFGGADAKPMSLQEILMMLAGEPVEPWKPTDELKSEALSMARVMLIEPDMALAAGVLLDGVDRHDAATDAQDQDLHDFWHMTCSVLQWIGVTRFGEDFKATALAVQEQRKAANVT